MNPVGRVNFEPNSYSGPERGPREDPDGGFVSFAADDSGTKRRLRASSFADHYSQAGLFFRSQTPVEQQHIADAFTFELSKVERATIRERMVANLRNADEDLAQRVGAGLGMATLPPASDPAAEPDHSLSDSPALSIMFEDAGSTPRPTSLSPGDVVVFYTDGATDVPPPHSIDNDQFTSLVEHAAAGATTAEQVADRLRSALESVLSFTRREDDIALLVLRITERA